MNSMGVPKLVLSAGPPSWNACTQVCGIEYTGIMWPDSHRKVEVEIAIITVFMKNGERGLIMEER